MRQVDGAGLSSLGDEEQKQRDLNGAHTARLARM